MRWKLVAVTSIPLASGPAAMAQNMRVRIASARVHPVRLGHAARPPPLGDEPLEDYRRKGHPGRAGSGGETNREAATPAVWPGAVAAATMAAIPRIRHP